MFYKGEKCVSVEKKGSWVINKKDVKMGWMNGILWMDCHALEARTVVVGQEGREISTLLH